MGAKTGWNSTVEVSPSMFKFLLALSACCLGLNSVATAPIYMCTCALRQCVKLSSIKPPNQLATIKSRPSSDSLESIQLTSKYANFLATVELK